MIMIVTQCFYPDVGGIENLMTGLADHLAAAGFPVQVFADRAHRKVAESDPAKRYTIHRFGGWRPMRRWRKSRAIARALADSAVSGIIADSWKSIEALPGAVKVPVAVLAHGMEYPANASRSKGARIVKALARCQTVAASSRYSAGLAQPYMNGGRLEVINPPVEALAHPSAEALAGIRERIAGRSPVIVTVARLEPRKGIDSVIRAMPAIRERHPGAVYLIGGAGADRERLERLAASSSARDAILFLGRISDAEKAALLASADVFAMPVRREGNSVEGFGISYLEAAWFGVPALGGRDCGAADAVLDRETGLLCTGGSQPDVTAALLQLLDDAQWRRQLGEKAQSRIHSELLWQFVLPRYLAAINVSL
jgi:phosphatidylinositol alpha-1,6-mannosyltransferase